MKPVLTPAHANQFKLLFDGAAKLWQYWGLMSGYEKQVHLTRTTLVAGRHTSVEFPSPRQKKTNASIFIASVIILLVGSISSASTIDPSRSKNSVSDKLREVEPLLRDGDVIFIRISNFLYRRVSDTSNSWESHVGIIFRGSDGRWSVAESTFPVSKFTALEKFVGRSEAGRFLVRRYGEGLTDEKAVRLRKSAQARMHKLYHLGFNYDSPRLFCSKFVYDVYKEATGTEMGRIETFRQLLSQNPNAPMAFWRGWFFGFVPWDRRCVTTTSQLKDPRFQTIFDTENAISE